MPIHYDLSRFKRNWAGLRELAAFLEQTSVVRRQEILSQLEAEDPDFFRQVSSKTIFFEELIYLESSLLIQLLTGISPRVLAYALAEMDETFRQGIFGYLSVNVVREIKDEAEKAENPSQGTILSARRQVLKFARRLEEDTGLPLEISECPRLSGSGR